MAVNGSVSTYGGLPSALLGFSDQGIAGQLMLCDPNGAVNPTGGIKTTSGAFSGYIAHGNTTLKAAYSIQLTDPNTFFTDATTASFAVNMIAVATTPRRPFTFVKTTSANTITLNALDGALFNGAASFVFSTQYAKSTWETDGSNWFQIA